MKVIDAQAILIGFKLFLFIFFLFLSQCYLQITNLETVRARDDECYIAIEDGGAPSLLIRPLHVL